MPSPIPPAGQPSQAGKFKPRKPQQKKQGTGITPGARITGTGRGRLVDRQGTRGRGIRGTRGRGTRGRGRGTRGRGGRQGGRVRFAAPKGQVFFTGSTASTSDQGGGNSGLTGGDDGSANTGVILMPGMRSGLGVSPKGEGEETVVGEFEDGGVGDGSKAKSKLDIATEKMERDFSNEEIPVEVLDQSMYTYDSDSSGDENSKELKISRSLNQKGRSWNSHERVAQPQQLPLPPPRKMGNQESKILYDSQKKRLCTEEIKDASIEDDPPIDAPFLDSRTATVEQKKEEQQAWMIFKFPTRLPRLDAKSTMSGQVIKSEGNAIDDYTDNTGIDIDSVEISDTVHSSVITGDGAKGTNTVTSTGYDDTLKDTAAGRYGKIIIHKSGKAFLVVGGGDSKSSPVRMRLSEGLPCGFLQQAVSVSETDYIPLGEVQKSLVVTPDIEDAFPM